MRNRNPDESLRRRARAAAADPTSVAGAHALFAAARRASGDPIVVWVAVFADLGEHMHDQHEVWVRVYTNEADAWRVAAQKALTESIGFTQDREFQVMLKQGRHRDIVLDFNMNWAGEMLLQIQSVMIE